MVNVVLPDVAELLAVSVSVAEPVVGFGEKDAVTPLGRPVTARFTLPVNPPAAMTLSVVPGAGAANAASSRFPLPARQ